MLGVMEELMVCVWSSRRRSTSDVRVVEWCQRVVLILIFDTDVDIDTDTDIDNVDQKAYMHVISSMRVQIPTTYLRHALTSIPYKTIKIQYSIQDDG